MHKSRQTTDTQAETSIKIFAAAIMVACLGYLGIHKGVVPGTGLETVERDLRRSAQAALQEAGIDWAVVTMTGQTAILSGNAPDAAAADDAAATVRSSVWAGGLVAGGITRVDLSRVRIAGDANAVIPVAAPFTWTAALSPDGGILLTGFVPGEQDRLDIATEIRSRFEIVPDDRSMAARGAPEGNWSAAAQMGLAALAQLESGTLTATDTRFTLTGTAADMAALNAAREQLADFPTGLSAVERISLAPAAGQETGAEPAGDGEAPQ